jgi:hypothetical protein
VKPEPVQVEVRTTKVIVVSNKWHFKTHSQETAQVQEAKVVESKQAATCPSCKQLKLRFIFKENGAMCTDCHIAGDATTRPVYVAAADWKAVSRELQVFSRPEKELDTSSISISEQERRSGSHALRRSGK